jgi:hypothetical protein
MKYNKGFGLISIVITAVIALIVGGSVVYLTTNTKSPKIDKDLEISNFEECVQAGYPVMESHPQQCRTKDGENFIEEIKIDEKEKEIIKDDIVDTKKEEEQVKDPKVVVSDNDVLNQPAYLINAYTKNNKNYIDVDYIQVFWGNASLQAQVADGMCPNLNDCYAYPNGYKRNQNPLVRTFEVDSNAVIKLGGSFSHFLTGNFAPGISVTFNQLKNITSQIPYSFGPSVNSPFKQPKTYISIDVQNNKVIKIIEHYQE